MAFIRFISSQCLLNRHGFTSSKVRISSFGQASRGMGSQPEEIQIPVPWGHISGKWWGAKNIQPIIALHGWQDNAGTFDLLAPLITKDVSLLCLDLPGHGFSSHLSNGNFYNCFWDGVILLRRIVHHHYKWGKIKLLGHSMGGSISHLYAASYPDEVELMISLDIVTPSAKGVVKSARMNGNNIDKHLKYEKLTQDNVPSYEYEEMIGIVFDGYSGNISRKSAEVLMRRGMRPTMTPGRYSFSRDPRLKIETTAFMMSQGRARAYAENIKCSYLNIRATQGFEYDDPEHYDEIIGIIKTNAKRFEHQKVDGSHYVHLNEPERVAPIISAFLASE